MTPVRRRAGIVTCALAVAAALCGASRAAAQPTSGTPLAALELEKGKLGWDGVQLGMSLVQAERKLGVTLALDRGSLGPCPAYVAVADHHGLTLTLGFANAKPGAKVEYLGVRFEGAQVLASGPELAAELRAKIPTVEWLRPAEPADLIEEEDLRPTYLVPGKKPAVVRLLPREALILAEPDCLD
jgi:hypothetical protein